MKVQIVKHHVQMEMENLVRQCKCDNELMILKQPRLHEVLLVNQLHQHFIMTQPNQNIVEISNAQF